MPYKNITQDPTLPDGFNGNFKSRFWKCVPITEQGECWDWKGTKDRNGYGIINRGNNRCVFAHRASWIINKGQIGEGLGVLHHCDNPACVNPNHLFLGTQQDNVKDCVSKGRNPKGEQCYQARFTWVQVREMRRLFSAGWNQEEIAREFHCISQTVWKIVHNKRWKE